MTNTKEKMDKIVLFCSDNNQETKYITALIKNDVMLIQFFNLFNDEKKGLQEYFYKFNSYSVKIFKKLLKANKSNFLNKLSEKFNSASACEDLISFANENKIEYKLNEGYFSRFGRYDFGDIDFDDYRYYDGNNNLIIPGFYKHPTNGIMKIYKENQFLCLSIEYKRGKKNGITKFYNDKTGTFSGHQYYTNDKLDGVSQNFDKNGNLEKEESFVMGKKEGASRKYYKNGNISEEIIYKANRKHGFARQYFENGQLFAETEFVEGKREGTSRQYYESGKLQCENNWKNDKPNGQHIWYYENGQISKVIEFKDGYYISNEKEYYENGNLKTVISLSNVGTFEGETTIYYPNKKIKNIFPYHNGKLHGTAKQYFKNGKIQYEYTYKNGLREGYSISYKQKTGEIDQKHLFQKGELIELYTTEGVIGIHETENQTQEKKNDANSPNNNFTRDWNFDDWIDPIVTNTNHTTLVSFAFNLEMMTSPFIIKKLYNNDAKNYIDNCQQENCYLVEDDKLLKKLLKAKEDSFVPKNAKDDVISLLARIMEIKKTHNIDNAVLCKEKINIINENNRDQKVQNRFNKEKECTKNDKIKNFNIDLVNCSRDIKFLTDKIIANKNLNFSMCIYGDPGTGKSAYARYLADKLGIDVVCRTAADILDQYVGNSEKLIAEAFEEAEKKKAMLIIDEVDSFLRSRGLAQRNWEVTIVNQMLTCMEKFNYPFICTTNFIDSLDQASLRRFTFKFKFGFLKSNQIEDAFNYVFNTKPSEEILKMKGLTVSDFVNIKKECDILGITDINEIAKMLDEAVSLKESEDLSTNVGFN